jgi:hypothetical protein
LGIGYWILGRRCPYFYYTGVFGVVKWIWEEFVAFLAGGFDDLGVLHKKTTANGERNESMVLGRKRASGACMVAYLAPQTR